MTDPSPTGCAIFEAVRVSLRSASSSSGLFTISQLLAMEDDLHKALAVIGSKIQAEQSGMSTERVLGRPATYSCFTGGRMVVIDCESSSDDGKEDEKEDTSTTGGNSPNPARLHRRSFAGITGSESGNEPSRTLGNFLPNALVQALIFSPISPDPWPLCDDPTQDGRVTRLLVCC